MKSKAKKSTDTHAARRRACWKAIPKSTPIDAMLITKPEDVSYLSGFAGDSSSLLVGPGWGIFMPGRYFYEQATREVKGMEVYTKTPSSYATAATLLKGRNIRRLGVQSNSMTLDQRDRLAKALEKVGKKKIVPIPSFTSETRAIKDDAEIRSIRKALRISQEVYAGLIAKGAKGLIGRTEIDICVEFESRIRELGATCEGFPTIVASGPNSARCHHMPTSRKVRSGEPLLIDFGARVDGYCSDLTRTLLLGKVPEKFTEIYKVVHDAQLAGIAAMRPGVRCNTVDAAARDVIVKAGYGENFFHGLGHGLGREVHEWPGFASTLTMKLKAGMLMTVEPGIYFPGVGGVRIEDDVLVTPTGHKVISKPMKLKEAVLLT